jgi:hypothetical protein
MKKERIIISFKARKSLRDFHNYLLQEVSKETADYVVSGILHR